MTALYGIGQAIIFLPCGFFLLLFSSPNLSGRRLDVYHTLCGHSANLECRSEMCCTRLAGKAGRKNRQKSPSGHHRTTFSGCLFATKAYTDNQKNVANSNTFSTCPYNMANFSPVTAEISSGVWGTLANLNRFRVLASLLQRRRSLETSGPNFARRLANSWAGALYIHFGDLAP